MQHWWGPHVHPLPGDTSEPSVMAMKAGAGLAGTGWA